jgi:hypothetical protein
MKLYHFTSDSGACGIGASGVIQTNLHHVLGEHFAWFTDNPSASGASLGLKRRRIGRSILTTDRMAHRIDAEVPAAERWATVRQEFTPQVLEMLERAPGVEPDSWWVSRVPVRVPFTVSAPLAKVGE